MSIAFIGQTDHLLRMDLVSQRLRFDEFGDVYLVFN